MFIVTSYPMAVLFCIVTMLCWGSWANTQKIAERNWKFELFYWDYVIGIVCCALILGLTLGSFGIQGISFVENLRESNSRFIWEALLGGIIFNAANILLGAAIAIAGMAVAFPVGIGIALVLGVLVNYSFNPLGNEYLLFSGVALIILAILLNAYAYHQKSSGNKLSVKGLSLSLVSGVLMGFFYKYVAASMFQDFSDPNPEMLSPYTAVFIFSLGVLISNLVFNSILMRFPISGKPVSYSRFFRGNWKIHLPGILGGAIWCIGMSFNILASEQAGPAISYGLGQGATLVAAVWGIFVWKEFQGAPKNTSWILGVMFVFFTLGLTLIILAR